MRSRFTSPQFSARTGHIICLCIVGLGLLPMLPDREGVAQETTPPFARVREKIEQALEREAIPSLTVAVSQQGKILWEAGFGWADRDRQVRATPTTPYSIASISKPITATGLMVLVERGRVRLDQPANELLSDAPLTAREGSAADATVRRLANHTAGLPLHYQFFYADEAFAKPPMAESIRRYGHLLAPPGEEYQYANFGYGVLDEIITRRAGKPYAEFMRTEVFEPLGMTDTAIGRPAGKEERCATRYATDGTSLPFYDFDHPGASAVFSSARDLLRFGEFHLGLSANGQQPLLQPAQREEMQRGTAKIGPGRSYGVGWFVDENEHGYRTVSHTGGMGGVRCRLVLVPAKQVVVVTLCNAGHDLPLQIAKDVLAEVLPDYGESYRKAPEHRPNPDPGQGHSPPSLVGFWEGEVATYAGNRTLQLWAHPDGDVKIRFAGELMTLLNHSTLRDNLLTGEFSGTLGTPDADRRPHRLQLRVRLRGERMSGALTAISRPAPRAGNAVSHWVELHRRDSDPQTWSLFNGHTLDNWRVANEVDFLKHGPVDVREGTLRLGAGRPGTGIVYTGNPPRDHYELTFEAKRTSGSDFFCGLTFPVQNRYLTLILGGWGGHVTGLSNLDHIAAVENETSGSVDFQTDRWYRVKLRVVGDQINVWLDDESLVDISTAGKKLTIWWEQEPMRPLGIATWYTGAAFRRMQLKRIPRP